jgi:hypothetical protein
MRAESLTHIQWATVLICQDTHGKLAKPTCGPYDCLMWHANMSMVVNLNHSHETFNIRQLIPFKPPKPLRMRCHTTCLTTSFSLW